MPERGHGEHGGLLDSRVRGSGGAWAGGDSGRRASDEACSREEDRRDRLPMVADAALAFKPKILYPYHFGDTDTNEIVTLLKDSGIEVRIRNLK